MFPIKGKPWAPHEVALLRKYFPKKTNRDVALYTGHTVKSVAKKAFSLGLKKENTGIRWTADMEDLLRANYPTTANRKLAEWLGVCKCAVIEKATLMGLEKDGRYRRPKRITPEGRRRDIGPEQEAFIMSHLDTMSMRAIGRALGYSQCTISRYCARKGIKPGAN